MPVENGAELALSKPAAISLPAARLSPRLGDLGRPPGRFRGSSNSDRPVAHGRCFQVYVARFGQQPEYQGLPQGEGEGGSEFGFTGKQGLLAKVFSTYRQAATQALLLEEPDLNTAIQAKKRERALYGR